MTTSSNDQSWAWNNLDHSGAAILAARHLPGVDHSSWKVEMYVAQQHAELDQGLVEIERELAAAEAQL